MPTVERTPVMDDLRARRGRARGAAAHGAKSKGPSGRFGRIGQVRVKAVLSVGTGMVDRTLPSAPPQSLKVRSIGLARINSAEIGSTRLNSAQLGSWLDSLRSARFGSAPGSALLGSGSTPAASPRPCGSPCN